VSDLRFALRQLRRSPGFTAAVVLTLGLGLGANTAIFSLVNAVLLRPLPVAAPDALVRFSLGRPSAAGTWGEPTRLLDVYSRPLYQRLRAERGEELLDLAAQQSRPVNTVVRWRAGEPPPEVAPARAVSGNFLAVVGAPVVVGRGLSDDDDRAEAAAVVVLSHGYWQRRFGGDPGVLGASLALNGAAYTVVGILGPGFTGITAGEPTDLWVPLAQHARLARGSWRYSPEDDRKMWWLQLVGRLAPGASAAAVQARANVLLQRWLAEGPFRISELPESDPNVAPTARDVRIEVSAGRTGLDGVRETFRRPLLVLMAAVAVLLLIVCLNVSHLLLARGLGRQRELGIRVALGASGGRLMRLLAAEGLWLALGGATLGLLSVRWVTDGLLALAPGAGALEARPDGRVWAFTAAVTLATAALMGLVPVWRVGRGSIERVLRAGAPTTTGSAAGGRALMAAQVALSAVLLVSAGLLGSTLERLRRLETGFDQHHLLTASILPRELELSPGATLALYDRLTERVSALPGVRATSLSAPGGFWMLIVPSGQTSDSVIQTVVTPEYFATVGLTQLAGRGFTRRDGEGARAVSVIDRKLARQLFGGLQAVGRRFRLVAQPQEEIEVVGVVSDARLLGPHAETPGAFYRPAAQSGPMSGNPTPMRRLQVRAVGDPAPLAEALRRALGEVAPAMPVLSVRTMRAENELALGPERFLSTLSGGFGAAALFLVAVGLYGVVGRWAAARTRELGVRMALGATAGGVRWLVLRQAFALVLAGLVAGVPTALAAARLLAGVLQQPASVGPSTLIAAVLALLAVAAAAAYLPARRASRIDPMAALRAE
jgi:predicted permease